MYLTHIKMRHGAILVSIMVQRFSKMKNNFVGCSVRCSEKQMLKSPVKLLI